MVSFFCLYCDCSAFILPPLPCHALSLVSVTRLSLKLRVGCWTIPTILNDKSVIFIVYLFFRDNKDDGYNIGEMAQKKKLAYVSDHDS